MGKLFDLFASIEIDSKSATYSLNAIKKDAQNLTSVLGKVGSAGINVGASIEKGMAVAGTAISAGVGIAGKLGMDFNSSMEQTKTAFTVFLGSGEKASKMVQDLSKLAKDTPFEMEELNKASTMLLNYGIAQDKVIPTMKMLGDIAMGDKEKLGGLSMALGQVKGNGRLMGEELNQMIERGFNPLNYIAIRTKKSVATLREEMSDGKISYEMVEQAIKDATSAGGSFSGSMDAMSKTFKGQMSTFSDNLNQTFGVIMIPLFNALTNKIIPFFNNNLGGMADNASSKMVTLKAVFLDVFGNIKGIIDQLRPSAEKFFNYLSTYIIPLLLTKIMQLFESINKNMPLIKTVVKSGVDIIIGVFNIFVSVVGFLIDKWRVLLPILIGAVATFKTFQILTLIVSLMKAWRTGTLLATLAQWGLNAALLANPIGIVAIAIGALIGLIVLVTLNLDWFKEKIGIVGQFFVDTWNNGVVGFKTAIDQIVSIFKFLWEIVKLYFSLYPAIINGVIDFFKWAFNGLVGFFTGLWSSITTGVSNFGHGIKSVFTGIRDAVTGLFKGTVNVVIGGINTMIRGLNKFKIKVPDWIPVIGGSSWGGFGIPQIPMLANGGTITKSGSAIVGEKGAELLNLPRGAQVKPLSKNGVNINIIEPKIFKTSDIDDLMNVITKRLKLSNVGR